MFNEVVEVVRRKRVNFTKCSFFVGFIVVLGIGSAFHLFAQGNVSERDLTVDTQLNAALVATTAVPPTAGEPFVGGAIPLPAAPELDQMIDVLGLGAGLAAPAPTTQVLPAPTPSINPSPPGRGRRRGRPFVP